MKRTPYTLIPLDEDISRARCRQWGIRVSLGYDPRTGKRLRPYEAFEGTESEARLRAEQIRAEHGFLDVSSGGMTIQEYFVTMWWPWKQKKVRATTARNYQSLMNDKLLPLFGSQKLEEINPYYIEMQLESIESINSREEVYKLLRNGLRQAVRWKLIKYVATEAVEKPQAPKKEQAIIKSALLKDYLDLFRGSIIEPAVLIGYSCGCRRSETVALDVEDIDFSYETDTAYGRFEITRSMHYLKKEWVTQPPKSRSSEREVFLAKWAGKRLEEILPESGPIMTENGHRIHPDRIGRLWTKAIEDENSRRKKEGVEELPLVPLKNLRHSCGTYLVREAKVPISDVQQMLGHELSSTTEKMYVQKGEESIERTASAMSLIRV